MGLIREGQHKSIHCEFCKPLDKPPVKKNSKPMLETKTKLNLKHQVASLRIINIFEEPGEPAADSAACVCQPVGKKPPCFKCLPDKKHQPPKKKTCKCQYGATEVVTKQAKIHPCFPFKQPYWAD